MNRIFLFALFVAILGVVSSEEKPNVDNPQSEQAPGSSKGTETGPNKEDPPKSVIAQEATIPTTPKIADTPATSAQTTPAPTATSTQATTSTKGPEPSGAGTAMISIVAVSVCLASLLVFT